MCGISGFVDFKKQTDRVVLEKMNRTMQHRGPDGEGYKMFNMQHANIGLGHRRLSIIDLTEGGSQPQHYKNYHITYNGEVYNYAEIKATLETLGHQFHSNSDTEVILHAYEQWGSDALHHFIGMFAFVIYDELNNTLFACRDRAGVKPFFYYWKDGLFLFASELKAIMQHPSFQKQINTHALAAYMQYGYVPAPHCIFNDTYKLNAGHYLQLNSIDTSLSIKQYWNVYDAYNKPTLKIDLPEAIVETEKILVKAFEYRMVSDVPVGVFLSGGYDSSCVTALLQKEQTKKLKTFTIGFTDSNLNEAPHAKKVAAHLGTDHTEYYCTQKEALEIVPQLPFYYDEPFADSSAIPTTLVSKIAKAQVTVALSADAGDEIFAGYSRYEYVMNYGKKLQRIPAFVRSSAGFLMGGIPKNNIPFLKKKHHKFKKMQNLFKDASDHNILLNLTKLLNDQEVFRLIKMPVTTLNTHFNSKELMPHNYNTLSYLMAIDYQTYLVDDILQKVDRAGMGVSLEGREPFLDHNIIEWAAQLPLHFKYKQGNKKFILKEIVHKYIPAQIMNRPKMGFTIPISEWLQTDLKMYVDEYLSPSFIQKQNIFNLNEVNSIVHAFYQQKTATAEKIWYLLMFQMWYDKWINGN